MKLYDKDDVWYIHLYSEIDTDVTFFKVCTSKNPTKNECLLNNYFYPVTGTTVYLKTSTSLNYIKTLGPFKSFQDALRFMDTDHSISTSSA